MVALFSSPSDAEARHEGRETGVGRSRATQHGMSIDANRNGDADAGLLIESRAAPVGLGAGRGDLLGGTLALFRTLS